MFATQLIAVDEQSIITVNGLGPQDGPGQGTHGQGANYGGTGGSGTLCNQGTTYFLQSETTIGDPIQPWRDWNNTYGSGGGFGGGAGGGRVVLSAANITILGTVAANGASSHNLTAGAGSGGTVVLEADSLDIPVSAIITATGGAGLPVPSIPSSYATGGGGGRIAVILPRSQPAPKAFSAAGGKAGFEENPDRVRPCAATRSVSAITIAFLFRCLSLCLLLCCSSQCFTGSAGTLTWLFKTNSPNLVASVTVSPPCFITIAPP